MIGTLLEKLFVAVGVDLSGFGSELSKASNEVEALSRDLKRDFEGVGRSWQATGQKMMKAGTVMTGAITAPLVLFGKAAAKAAIDAEEMQSAFNVVFGKMAGDVRKWAETTGNAMGRSTQELQRGALAFQELFGKALDPQKSAEMSKQFALLTQDLASFKNLSNEVAQQKLFSGLIGEAEPLRAVGVFLSEDAVKAKALQMGLKGVNGDLTDQEKILARAAIIREQLKQADGDVMRTSESTANRIRASQAAFEELSITVGTILIPALTPLISAVASVLEGFNTLSPGMQTFIVGAAGVAAILGPAVVAIGGLVSGIGALMPLIGAAIPIISGLAGGLAGLAIAFWPVTLAVGAVVAAWYYWDEIVAIVKRVGSAVSGFYRESVKPAMDAVLGTLKPIVAYFMDIFGPAISSMVEMVSSLLKGDFAGAWNAAKSFMLNILVAMGTAAANLSTVVTNAMAALFNGVKTWVQDRLGAVFNWLKGKLKEAGVWFFELYDSVVGHSYIPDMVDGIGEEMAKLQKLMVDPAEKATKKTKEAFRDLARDTAGIMGQLFPDQAEVADLKEQMAILERAAKAGIISPDAAGAAKVKLTDQLSKVQARMAGPGDAVQGLISNLLPREEEVRRIREDMATLDAAIAAGRGNVDQMKRARAELDEQMAKATEWPLADELRSLTDALFPAQAAITKISSDMQLLNEAFAAGKIDPELYEQAMASMDEAMEKAEEALQQQSLIQTDAGRLLLQAKSFGQELGDGIMGGLRDWLTVKKSLGDALRDGLTRVLDNAITQSLRNLETAIFGKGGLGGFIGNALGSLFGGGARAVGGPVLPGRAYDVGLGEKFVPSAHGRVLSRSDAMAALGGGGRFGPQINVGGISVSVQGRMSEKEARRTGLQVGRAALQEINRASRMQP